MTDKTGQLITFGCRLNIHESEVIRQHLQAAQDGNTVVVNTCAVTREAERQARQAIRRARRERPDARIVVTGCAAQIAPQRYAAMPEVDRVVGNDGKMLAETWRAGGLDRPGDGKVLVNEAAAMSETAGHLLHGFEGHTRAFVQVQNGCDHRCTFCIIPFGRGPSRSVPVGEVVRQVRQLVEAGYREVVLSGVDATAYGADLPGNPTLGQLCRRVLAQIPGLPRLRLSSVDPKEIDDDLWRLIAEEPRLMPHLHLSVQAGDDLILKRMKRRHCRADVVRTCSRARSLRPDMVFGADLIAGFPTEDDDRFDNTLRLIDEAGLTYLHVFPYSEREGTPAARMPAVPKPLRKERAGRLRAAGQTAVARFYEAQVGGRDRVLVEKAGFGRTETFAATRVPADLAVGSLSPVRIRAASASELFAEPHDA